MLVNLTSFVQNAWTQEAYFEWGKFANIVQKAQRLMDDMIDLEIEQIDKIMEKIKLLIGQKVLSLIWPDHQRVTIELKYLLLLPEKRI